MTTTGMTVDERGISGPIRHPVNAARNAKGSIHDDATASKLGLRGGTVAGSVHLDLFPPLLNEAFGRRWFQRGSLSIDFLNPTIDGEPVRACLGPVTADAQTGDVQVEAWLDREDGMRVGEGTAAVGDPGRPTALWSKQMGRGGEGEFRILAGVTPGEEIPERKVTIEPDQQRSHIERGLVAEPFAWYSDASPWGKPVLCPQLWVHHLYQPGSAHLTRHFRERGGSVGLFGAIELVNLDGPLLVGATYTLGGRVVALGQSPKTEYAWFEVTASDGDRAVASLLMQLRFMKASSPLYS